MRKYRRIRISYAEKALRRSRSMELTRFRHISLIMLAGLLGLFQTAYAGPEGEQVVAGDVSFNRNGSLTEITASDNSIINYESFDIAGNETVRFIQPSEAARVLNRIQGDDPTTIAGKLLANGQVYIVNPAGIYFTNGSLVDVGELYAAAGDISDQEFMAGLDHFTGVSGSVVNDGQIVAETVALVGQYVANNGEIFSDDGLITLAVGDDVYLTRHGSHIMVRAGSVSADTENGKSGVENTGDIYAGKGSVTMVSGDMYALAMGINTSGTVTARNVKLESGQNGITTVSGTIDASDTSDDGQGGKVAILGDRVGLFDAEIDASGSAGGGEVLVGGDYQGMGQVKNSQRTVVDDETSIKADSLTDGDGGKVVLWADDYTLFKGDISAKGGTESGDGGFVEVSGKESLSFDGGVDTTAANGQSGHLLLDPSNVEIVAGNGGGDDAQIADFEILGGDGGGTFTISEDVLEALAAGTNIKIEAYVDITISSLTDNILDLNTGSGNTVSFIADSNDNNTGNFSMNAAHSITTNGGNVIIDGVNVTIGTVNSNDGAVTITADELTLNTAINAGAGTVHIYPRRSRQMDIGTFVDGLDISNAELGRITTSGVLILGDSINTSSMELEGVTDIANVGTVRFLSNGSINSTNGNNNTITTPVVEIFADDGVTLDSDLTVTNALTINADYDSDSTGTFRIVNNTDNITAGSTVSITASDLNFSTPGAGLIDATGAVTLIASNNRTMGIGSGNFNISDSELDSITSGASVTLDTASSFIVDEDTTYTGNLSIVAGTGISRGLGDSLEVTGDFSATVDVAGGSIVLDHTANNVSGTVSFATLGTGDATWYENGDIVLGTTNIGDALTVRSINEAIVQNGIITTGGNASFTTLANDKDITLITQNNAVGGSVAFTTNNTTGDVFWKEDANVSLAASTIDGNITVVSNTGTITQSGALTVSGTGDFTTSTNNRVITLGNTSNNIAGQVAFITIGTTGNVTFDNGSNAIDFGASTINGSLNLDTGGHLTVNGAVVTTGGATINADDITMASTLNAVTADITIVVDDNGTLGLGATGGDMTLTDTELDNITSSGTVWFDTNGDISVDAIDPANMTGTVRIDSAGQVSFINGGSSFAGGLYVLGDDIVVSQTVDVTGNMQIEGVGVPIYLGDGGGGNMDITGTELANITAANLEINAGNNQNIYVNNISAANSNNVSGTVTLDSSEAVIFQTASSTFNALTVEANDGIQINDGIDLTTDTGAMSLDGNIVSNGSTVAIATDIVFDSAGNFTIHETTAGGDIDITSTNINIANSVNYGANDVIINSAGTVGIGSGAGAMAISGAELQRLSGTGDVTITTTNGNVTVDNVPAANSDNIDGTLIIETTGNGNKVIFSGSSSTFNTLTANAPDGIDVNNVLVTTDTGAFTLDPDTDGGGELISFIGVNAGMSTATDFTLGSISVADALTLRANGNIRFTANQTAPDGFNIYADNDGVGGGSFTVDAGVSLTTTDSDININGLDLIMGAGASLDAGTGDIAFGTQQAVALVLGTAGSGFGISDTELDAMTAANIVIGGVSSAGYSSVVVDGDFSSGTKTLTIETDGTFTIDNGVTLSTTDKAITISADDLIMNATGAINSGTVALSLNTMIAGTDIVLGGTGQEFNIDDTELSNITSGSLTLTALADDDIYVSGISLADGDDAGNIVLTATGAGSKIIVDTAAVHVDALTATANDGITIGQNITTYVGNLSLEGDSDNAANGSDNLAIADNLTLTSAGSLTLAATTGGIDAAGALTLNAVSGVTLSDAYSAAGAGNLTVDADTNDDGVGTFTASSTVSTNDSLVSITAADIALSDSVNAGTGGISILPSEAAGQTLGFGGAGDMALSSAEVGYLVTSGPLTVGNGNTTTLTISTDPANATGTIAYIANAATGNIVINTALNPDTTLSLTAREGITINNDITTSDTITIDSDSDDAGNGTLTLGAGADIDSTDNGISITSKDIDIDGTASLDSGTAAMTITQSQGAGTIGLGATAGTMTLNDSEIDNITANGLTIFAPSDITIDGISNNGGNIDGTFLIDATGKATFASSGSSFSTLSVQADDGVTINNVTVSTGVGAINIDGNVDNSSDTTDTISFVGIAGLSSNTTLNLTATNDGLTSGGDTTITANGAVTISDKFIASSDLEVTSVNSTLGFSSDFTGGGITDFNADDGITFNGNVVLGGATTIDSDTDPGDDVGTFTLAGTKSITTNGHALSITADDIDLAGGITGGAGLITFDVSDGGTMGIAGGAGNMQISSAELTRITGQTGGITFSGSDALVTVNGMTTDSNLAGIAGMVTIDASNDGASVIFNGAASKAEGLTVDSDGGIEVQVNLTTTAGDMILEGDSDNANDPGDDDIKFVGARTLSVAGGELVMDATTGKISGNASLIISADDGVTINDNLTVDGQITIDADLNDDATGTLTLAGVVDSTDNLIDIIADDLAISTGGLDSGTANIRLAPSTAISMGLGAGAGNFSITDAELDTINAENLYLGMAVATNLTANNLSTTTITDTIYIDITGTFATAGALWDVSADNNDLDITANDIDFAADLDTGSGTQIYRTSDGGGICLGAASLGMNLGSGELAHIISSGGVTFETQAGEDIDVNNITNGSTDDITGTLTLDASSNGSQVNITTAQSVLKNDVVILADDGIDIEVDLTVQSGDLSINGDNDNANDGNSRDYINISDGVTIEATVGDMVLNATTGDILADGALTLVSGGNMTIADSLTTNSGASTNKALLIEASDLDFTGTALNADAGAITIRPSSVADMGLGGTATGNFDLTDAEFDKITTSGVMTFGGTNAADITVDGFTAPATVTGEVVIVSGQNNSSVTFASNASSFIDALTVNAREGVIFNHNVTADGIITIDSDTDNDNDGTLTIAATRSINSTDNNIDIIANDMNVTGTVNAGTGDISITDSDNTGISLGATVLAGGINLTGTELQNINAANAEFITSGDVTVDGITAANSNNITNTVTIDTAGDIQFTNTASTFNKIICEADGAIDIDVDITTDTGSLELYGDTNGNAGAVDSISFAAGVTADSATSMRLNASSGGALVSGISGAGALDLEAVSTILLDNTITAGGLLTINADTDTNGTGDLTIALGAGVNASGHNVDITANTVTFGAGILTNVDDLALYATINGDLEVNGDFGNTGSVELVSLNGSLTINSQITSNESFVLTAKNGITINNNIIADFDTNNPGGESISINADSDTNGVGSLTVTTNGKSITTNSNDMDIDAADLDMQDDYEFVLGSGKLTITETNSDGIGLGDTALASGLNITTGELVRISTAELELITSGNLTVDNVTEASSDNITLVRLDNAGQTAFSNNASFFNSLTVEADDGIVVDQDITCNDSGSLNLDGDADIAADTNDDIQIANGITLQADNAITLAAQTGKIVAAGTLDLISEGDITINDNLTAADVITINTDGIAVNNDGTGDLIIAADATVSTEAVNEEIYLTANDLFLNGSVRTGNSVFDIVISDNQNFYLGTSAVENGSNNGFNINQAELTAIYSGELNLTTNGNINISGVSGGVADNIADMVTFDINGRATLSDATEFNAVTILANDGIVIDDDLTSLTGDIILDADYNNAADGFDKVTFAANATVSSADSITIDATNGLSTTAGDLNMDAVDGVTINDSISAGGDIVIDADSDVDGSGAFTVATAGKSILTNDNDLTITASDLLMLNDYAFVVGTGKATVNESNADGVGFGDTAVVGGMNISTDELVRISASELEIASGGNIVIDNITEPSSDNITLVTIDSSARVNFDNNASLFNSVTVQADNGIVVNQDITCDDSGSMSLDGDADIAFDGNDYIRIANGITLQADDAVTLAAQTGKITALGTLDIVTEGDITINDNLTAGDVITIDTDGIVVNNDGIGDLIVAGDATVSTEAVNKEIYVNANDIFLNGFVRTGTSTIDISVTDNENYYLGSNAVENGSNNGFNINATELSHVYTGNLNLTTAGNINISDILAGAADNITYMVTFTIDGHAVLSNDCIFNAITILANDGIELGGSLTTQSGEIILDGDLDDAVSGGGFDDIQFASGSTVSSADVLTLDATTGALTGLGSLILEAAEGININDNLSTNGDLTINADSDLDGTGDLASAPGKTYSCNGNDLNITAANVQFDSGIANVDGLFLTATTGNMEIAGGISFNNTGDLGLAVTNGTCVIDKVLTAQGAVTISASGGVTIQDDITSNGDMIINADNDADGVGDLSIMAGVDINSNNGMIFITTKDINDLNGSINSGTNITTIDSTGIGIALGSSNSSGMRLSNYELSRITAETIEFITDGNINVGNVNASSNQNIGTVILNAQGRIQFENGASVFNTLDVQAEGGIVINSDLATDTGELMFNNDSVCLSGGSNGIVFDDGVTVTSATGLTIGGAGDLTANSIVNFLTSGDMSIQSDFNISSGLNIDIAGNDLFIDNVDVNVDNGPVDIFAGDFTLTGTLSSLSDTITIVPFDSTVALGTSTASLTLDNSELAAIAADRLVFDSAGNITVASISDDSTSNIVNLILDSEAAVLFDNAVIDSNLEVYSGAGISQAGRLVVTGTGILTTNQDDQSIILDNSANAIAGNITLNTQSSGSGLAAVSLNNGISDIVLDSSVVSGDIALETLGSVSQTGALDISGDMTVSTTQLGSNITLDNTNNSIDGNVAFYTESQGNVSFDNGSDNIAIAEAVVGGNMTLVSNSDVSDIGSVKVDGDLTVTTTADSGADIILDNTNNYFGRLNLYSYNSAGNQAADGDIYIVENDAVDVDNIITAGNLDINAAGSITEYGSMSVVGNVTLRVADDTDNDISLNGINNLGNIDISINDSFGNIASGNVSIIEQVTMQIDRIVTSGQINFTADDFELAGAVTGSGLIIEPLSDSTTIAIGNSAAGNLKLDNDEIALLTDGFGNITIGRTDASGNITVSQVEFTDPITLLTSGTVLVSGEISGTDNASIAINSGAGITISDNIVTTGNDISLSGGLNFTDSLTVSTTKASGDITLDGNVDTVGGISLVAGNDIVINGTYQNVGAGQMNFDGNLLLTGDVDIAADNAKIWVNGFVNGLYDFDLHTSGADIIFADDMGISQEIANLSVVTTGIGKIEFNSTINVAGNIYISSEQPLEYIPSEATIYKGSSGDLVFNLGGDFTMGANNRLTVSEGALIINSAAGEVTLGDTTVKGNIIVDAVNGEGDIILLARDKTESYTVNKNGTIRLIRDKGLNLAAEGYIQLNGTVLTEGEGTKPYFVTGNRKESTGLQGYKVYTIREFEELIVDDPDGQQVIIVYIPVNENQNITVDPIVAAVERQIDDIYHDSQIGTVISTAADEGLYIAGEPQNIDFAQMWQLQ